jgi:hypothetical protein
MEFIMKQWLNEKNWLILPQTQEAILHKKNTFYALSINKQSFQTRFNSTQEKEALNLICKDIDCCAFILSSYMFQHEKLEQLPNIKKHFSNMTYVKYILSQGIISSLQDILFTQYPQLKNDKNLALKVLKNNSRSASHYHELFKDYDFVLKCLNKKIFCIDFLELYPKNKIITKKLLKARYFPRKENISLYNEEVLKDKKFILPILLETNGYFLYDFLPKILKQDLELCDALKAKHPHVQVEVSSINTIEKFIDSLNSQEDFATEIYTIICNMQNAPFIINNSQAIAQVFKKMGEKECSCYVDLMGDPSFSSHPIQDFLNEVKIIHPDIHDFLQTEEGKKIINFKIKNYTQFMDFEQRILPSIGEVLHNYLEAYQLNHIIKDNKKVKSKKQI